MAATISNALERARRGGTKRRPASGELRRIETSVSRLTWAMLVIALMVCGTLLLINGIAVAGVIALVMAVPVLIRLLTL